MVGVRKGQSKVSAELSELSPMEVERYSRQIVLKEIGFHGQVQIKRAKVSVVGLGGLGNLIAMKLASMGVGLLRLIDRDVVSLSDLHRQPLYDMKSIGYAKAEAAAKKLQQLNPEVDVEPNPQALTWANADELLSDVDVVADGLDSIETRYIVNRSCIKSGTPYLFGGAIDSLGMTSTIIPHGSPCLECFAPDLTDESLEKCAVVGVHPSVVGLVTNIQVAEAIRVITRKEPNLLGKMLYVDLANLSFDVIKAVRSDSCPACGSHPTTPPETGSPTSISLTCGRDGRGILVVTPKETLSLDIRKLTSFLLREGFKVKAKGRLGVTFDYDERLTLSVLRSGSTIAQVAPGLVKKYTKRKILSAVRSILSQSLSVPKQTFPLSE